MQKLVSIFFIVVAGGACMTASALGEDIFTVGSDEEYRTISSALARMKEGDTCIIKEGVYRECIQVPQDNITIRGDGRVVATGCDEPGKPEPATVNGHAGLVFDVGKPVYDAFGGSRYLPQARFPNKTSSMTSNEDWAFATIEDDGDVRFTEPNLEVPQDLDDGYYVGAGTFSTWYSLTLPIVGVRENGSLRIDGENASSGYRGRKGKGKGLGYVIGAKAALDAPGEWYSDGRTVWIIPPAGEVAGYELRTRLYGVVVTGNGVTLENLRFYAAAARVEGNDVSFRKCSFEYISPFQHNPNPKNEPENRRGQSMVSCWGTPDNGTAGSLCPATDWSPKIVVSPRAGGAG